MTEADLEKIAAWFRSEFKRRTDELLKGSGKIEWLVADYRVSRTEVVSYAESLGITMTAQDNVQLFHYLNQKKVKRNAT